MFRRNVGIDLRVYTASQSRNSTSFYVMALRISDLMWKGSRLYSIPSCCTRIRAVAKGISDAVIRLRDEVSCSRTNDAVTLHTFGRSGSVAQNAFLNLDTRKHLQIHFF
jgi:hypothetical protein